MKAINIDWDTDGEDIEELNLPTEVDIPEELEKEFDSYDDDIADWLSDTYGFCLYGFDLIDE